MYPMGAAAYDRAITVFSPDGRLFQVEYAREAVKRGTTAVGITYNKGVLLAVDKSIGTPLIVPESVEKIFQIDDHIGAAASGLVADARRLIEEARMRAQRNKLAYNEPISVSTLTKHLCDLEQSYTQYGGVRPFGTTLLVAGINEEPQLFETDPSGAFTQYVAAAIGIGKRDVEKIFEEEYKKGSSRADAMHLALKGLNSVSEEKIKKESIDVITIDSEKNYQKVDKEEIGGFIDEL